MRIGGGGWLRQAAKLLVRFVVPLPKVFLSSGKNSAKLVRCGVIQASAISSSLSRLRCVP